MAIEAFPPLETADEHGLLALGGDLEPDSLILAYTQGIFPWPINDEYPLAWFSPDPRGVLYTEELHISKSLKKFLRKNPFQITFNQQFEAVIKNCALQKRLGQESTWITDELMEAYIQFHRLGFAYSVEVLNQDQKLVGGLYGVNINKYFSGESMFHLEDNASKVALIALVSKLREFEIPYLDTQMVTPIIKSMGGREISRNLFLQFLSKSLQN
ncbi:MAG: leucyl/phenylalanyl-tRNA--protein transferase [Bacteriovoracaceae bacterium]|nr:leucyl/phenylalanyl-tRNA--protein transferase [Bacteriovoracaceae bacterium]